MSLLLKILPLVFALSFSINLFSADNDEKSTVQILAQRILEQSKDERIVLRSAARSGNTDVLIYLLELFKRAELLNLLAQNETIFPMITQESQKIYRATPRLGGSGLLSFEDIIMKAAIWVDAADVLDYMLKTTRLEDHFWLELAAQAGALSKISTLKLLLADKRYKQAGNGLLNNFIRWNKPKAVKTILEREQQRSPVMKKLLRFIDYPEKSDIALVFGACMAHHDVVELALAQGADPNFSYGDENYFGIPKDPPIVAAAKHSSANIVQTLLQQKDLKGDGIQAALAISAAYGDVETTRMLLEDRRSGRSILHRFFNRGLLEDAVKNNREQIVVLLLEHNRANPEDWKDQILEMSISCPEIIPCLPKTWLSEGEKIERGQIN